VQPAVGDPASTGGWSRWSPEVPSNPEHSVIVRGPATTARLNIRQQGQENVQHKPLIQAVAPVAKCLEVRFGKVECKTIF